MPVKLQLNKPELFQKYLNIKLRIGFLASKTNMLISLRFGTGVERADSTKLNVVSSRKVDFLVLFP